MCGAMTTRKKKNREDTRTERGIDMTNEEFIELTSEYWIEIYKEYAQYVKENYEEEDENVTLFIYIDTNKGNRQIRATNYTEQHPLKFNIDIEKRTVSITEIHEILDEINFEQEKPEPLKETDE